MRHEAILWEPLGGDDERTRLSVRCNLCSHRCVIPPGKLGACCVRENVDGRLYTLVYDRTISQNVDPIEKKPFFHFLPGTKAFSIATPGCNFRCAFCQNWEISQMPREQGDRAWGSRSSRRMSRRRRSGWVARPSRTPTPSRPSSPSMRWTARRRRRRWG